MGKSISFLITGKTGEEAGVKLFMGDYVYVAYGTVAHRVGSETARTYLNRMEDQMLEDDIYPLNIDKNEQNRENFPELDEFLIRLNRGF